MKNKKDQYFPYFVLVGMVAIVAIIALVLFGNGRLEGAQVYKIQTEEMQNLCTDDDPNNDFYVQGIVKKGVIEYLDYCLNDERVYQYRCGPADQPRVDDGYNCPNGCLNGACIDYY